MKVMMCWKLLALALITVYLFGCRDDYGYDVGSGPGIVGQSIPGTTDTDTVMQEPVGDEPLREDEHAMPEVEVPELDLEDIERILDAIEVPVGTPAKSPKRDSDPPEVPELDLEDIERILDTLEVPVGTPAKPPKRDSDPPEIIDSNIENGAEDVGRNSIIRITFNEPIVDGDLRLRIKGGDTVKTRVNYGNETVHLERLGKNIVMKPLTTYVVGGTVSDAAGNETEVEFTFTTGEENF